MRTSLRANCKCAASAWGIYTTGPWKPLGRSAERIFAQMQWSPRWAHQAIPRHGCIPAEPAAVSPGKIIVPRIVIGGVVLEQPAGGGIGAASVGPRVCGRV